MKIFIVSLKHSTARQQQISERLDNLNLKYHFFDAINGKANPNFPLFNLYNAKKHLLHNGRNLSLGELGCYASHYLLWQKCVETNQAYIVLEDDVIILDNFLNIYQDAELLAEKYKFLWLHKSYKGGRTKQIAEYKNYNVILYLKEYVCTLGYIISPTAAKILLNHLQEWTIPVDDAMGQYYLHGILSYAIDPACIQETAMESTIASCRDITRRKKTLADKIRIETLYFLNKLKKFYFDHTQI